VAVHERPPFEVKSDGAGEHTALDVTALADEILGAVLMADPLDVLLDDRALIEIGGDVVRRRADQLDAAGVRLVVGLGALEARQEAVVDVDAAPREKAREIVRQDLHVAGEHDELGAGRVDQRHDARFLLGLGILRDRQMVEGHRTEIAPRVGLARMVGDDADDVHGEFADTLAIEQIDEAMVELGGEQQHAAALAPCADRPLHRERGGDRREAGAQCLRRRVDGHVEDDPHEEAVGFDIVELVRLEHVAAEREQLGGDARDDARPVRAGEGQDKGGAAHDPPLTAFAAVIQPRRAAAGTSRMSERSAAIPQGGDPSMIAPLFALAAAVAPPAAAPIDPARLSDITRTLAAPAFEGRAPGTAGEAKTVDYLIGRFRALGLEPGGENGGWTQAVPLLRTQLDTAAPVHLATPAGSVDLAQDRDVSLGTRQDVDVARIANAPLVFVGYGVTAPERGWDDYKGADLHGKVAVFLVNDPDFYAAAGEPVAGRFGGRAMTYYGRWTYKFEEAERHGAVSVLIVHDTDAAGYGWSTVAAPHGESYDIRRPDQGASHPALEGWISHEAAQALFRGAGLDLDRLAVAARGGNFRPVPLAGVTLSAAIPATRERIESHNVVAKLTGRIRPDEAILFGAHWDAYGIKPGTGGLDAIRPGAADDALGVAGVLELARTFAQAPRTARTLVFAAWTGEERGLLGSEYYAEHPLVPAAKTVADLTMDVLQTAGPARNVMLASAGQSADMDAMVAAAAARQGRTVTPDPKPERGLFYRADHFSLAKRGVPAELLMGMTGGLDLVNGGRPAGDAWLAAYMKCYHQSCDRWDAGWDLRGAAQDVALFYDVGRRLADSDAWPRWSPASEFAHLRP